MLKLLRFLRSFTAAVAAVFILVFAQSISELYLPNLMSRIVNIGIVQGDTAYIMHIGSLMLVVTAGGALCAVASSFLSARTAMGFGKILRDRLFSHVLTFSLHEFNKIGTPSLITRTTNDITQIQMVTMFVMRMIISAPIMFIGGIIMAVSKDPSLSWVFIGALPLLAAIIFAVAAKGLPLFRAMQQKIDALNRILREGLTGIRVIRAFNRTGYETRRFQEANLDLTGTAIKVNRIMALLMPVMMLVMNLTAVVIVWFGAVRIDRGEMLVGDLMAFLQYSMQIMFSLLMASMMFIMIPRAQASASRINEVLAVTPAISESRPQPRPADQPVPALRGQVEFRNVTFYYPGAEEPALEDISFCARPGEVTAIIGGTGSGKTTLINLIPRFYDPTSGSVLVEGTDVREIPLETLRSKIGLVPQKAVLFSGTAAENIRFGKEDAADEEVKRAAEVAQISDFIASLPEGFQTVIAQGGVNLSGGQKQRLAIARALIRKPSVYIFDESFSALDFKTDAQLRAALRQETKGATVIIVAQRVNTIMDADQIIVMDNGHIVGTGKHSELVKTCPVYREIVASQLSEEAVA